MLELHSHHVLHTQSISNSELGCGRKTNLISSIWIYFIICINIGLDNLESKSAMISFMIDRYKRIKNQMLFRLFMPSTLDQEIKYESKNK